MNLIPGKMYNIDGHECVYVDMIPADQRLPSFLLKRYMLIDTLFGRDRHIFKDLHTNTYVVYSP